MSSLKWLPPVNWTAAREVGIQHSQIRDLRHSLWIALCLTGLRYLIESFVLKPIGRFFINESSVFNDEIKAQKTLNFSNQVRVSKLTKFTETAWRFLFYLTISLYGYVSLENKDWFQEPVLMHIGHIYHSFTEEIKLYFNLELAFYVSLLCTQFFDVKRSDFWVMMIHHVLTIFLILMSVHMNAHRLGAFIMFLHDISDVFLELGKCLRYINFKNFGNFVIFLFMIVWCFTRLYLYSNYVFLHSTYMVFKTYDIFVSGILSHMLMALLLCLNLFWTWILVRILAEAIFRRGTRDIREDDSD